MIYVGIDPGLEGGIAAIRVGALPVALPAPVLKDDTAGRSGMDRRAMCRILRDLRDSTGTRIAGYAIRAYIEKVHSMPKQGVASSFKFGKGFGEWLGILEALEIPTEEVTPQRWMKSLLDGSSNEAKQASISKAQALFPGVDLRASERSRKPHTGKADALLIAEFNRRQG